MDEQLKPPKETTTEVMLRLGKAIVGETPLVGGILQEFFDDVFRPGVSRRNEQWQESVGAALVVLRHEHGQIFERLEKNEAFLNTFIAASRIAPTTNNEEKLKALRNAVLNSALPGAPDEARQHMFLKLVDDFTGEHLWLLKTLAHLDTLYETSGKTAHMERFKTVWELLVFMYSSLKGQDGLYEQLGSDLHRSGLVILHSPHDKYGRYHYDPEKPRYYQQGYMRPREVTGEGGYVQSPRVARPWTSQLGDEFLNFIRSPNDDEKIATSDGR